MSSKRKEISRREFLSQSTKTAAGVFATAALASCDVQQTAAVGKGRVIGANDRINMAIIGIRSRGNAIAHEFAGIPNVRFKTLCDVDENLFPKRVEQIGQKQGFTPSTEYDLRRVFDDKDIDAVAIGAPNHWHALATIWACQAGKHVYVEKPCSHNIWEGRKMIEAARKYNSLVQVGFQNRSIGNVCQAMKFLHDGNLGDIYMARGLCFKPRNNIGKYPDGPMSENEYYSFTVGGGKKPPYDRDYLDDVHYDLWLGPAPKRPFNPNRFHYNWHWHWDYGNGDIGNQGPHQFDIARWGMNKNEHPVKVSAFGGYFAFTDSSQEAANTQVATYEYSDGKILQFEVRGLYSNAEANVRIGNLFFGSKGWMWIYGSEWKTYFGRKNEPGPSSTTSEPAADPMNLAGTGGGGHCNNFIQALRAGKRQCLTCDIETGYMSTVLPHLANISYRLGREVKFDGAKERFIGDREANCMLTRKYRSGYVVPKRV